MDCEVVQDDLQPLPVFWCTQVARHGRVVHVRSPLPARPPSLPPSQTLASCLPPPAPCAHRFLSRACSFGHFQLVCSPQALTSAERGGRRGGGRLTGSGAASLTQSAARLTKWLKSLASAHDDQGRPAASAVCWSVTIAVRSLSTASFASVTSVVFCGAGLVLPRNARSFSSSLPPTHAHNHDVDWLKAPTKRRRSPLLPT